MVLRVVKTLRIMVQALDSRTLKIGGKISLPAR